MRTRRLGRLEVSEVGTGCMGFSHGYGTIPSPQESVAAIRAAHDAGCTFFDTAEGYGPNLLPENAGHNERLLGEAVEDFRDDVVLATKLHLPTDEVRRDGVLGALRRHLEGSLERLRTDHVELYYLHRINPEVPVERGVEQRVVPWCLEHAVTLVAFSPVGSGLLSGKVTPSTRFEANDDVRNLVPQLSAQNLAANQDLVQLLGRVAREKGATSAQVSLAWMLAKYPNVVPIPGSKNRGRILENLGASEVRLSDDEFTALERELDAIEVHGHRGFDESTGRRFVPVEH